MRIEETAVSGWKTCGRNRRAHGGCEGYTSEPVDLIVEKISVTFGDVGSPAGDPYHPITSHEHIKLRPAHEQDWKCSHCGEMASLSLEPRVEFPRLSETGPEEIVRRAEAERARDQRSEQALDAGERQAIALERLAAGLATSIDRASEQKNGNGNEADELRTALVEQGDRMKRMAEQLERQESVIKELQPLRRPPGRPRKAETEP